MRPALTICRLAPLVLVALAASCQQLPEPKGMDVRVMEIGRLEQANPNDIVVAPLQFGTEEPLTVPEFELREAFVQALIRRRYAPLALEYVDMSLQGGEEGTVEASYRTGLLDEDAVCQIVVHNYDDSLWDDRKALTVDLEVRMVDPTDPLGPALWAGRLERRFDFADDSIDYASSTVQYKTSLDHIAQELLAAMPARRTEPGFE